MDATGRGRGDDADASILPARKRRRFEDSFEVTSNHTTRVFRCEEYTVGWVTALPVELAAAAAMLDTTHPTIPPLPGDDNFYRYGSIGPHNIVIACLPSGQYGTNNAAVVAANMARSFPSISIRLMVGIGGGVPKDDVRLGDVVVGHDVLQYDLGKTVRGGEFNCISHPVKPPQGILTALSSLRAEHERRPTRVPAILSEMLQRNRDMIHYGYPTSAQDRLFEKDYEHSDLAQECDQCDQSKIIRRHTRPNDNPHIHYGTIASGNQVVKHAMSRDNWASCNNILCFEMEAAGLVHHFQCLVIRGICDYCDSHKNKIWQKYAAATAAAYAKEFLQSIEASSDLMSRASVPHTMMSNDTEVAQNSLSNSIKETREERFASLMFDQIDNRRLNIKKAHLKTCEWMLKKDAYLDWMDPQKLREHGGFLWIKGKPGAGKSTMMKFISDKSQRKKTHLTTIDFFFNARGHGLEKSTTGLYQSILLQLLTKIPTLQNILDCPRLFANGTPRQWTNELLEELIERAIEKLTSSVICYIDALDECNDNQIRDMIRFFERLGQLAMSTGVGLYMCFSSRYYPHISMREGLGLEIILENQRNHGDDIREYVNSELAIGQGKLAEEIKNELLEKSSGVFMWAVLVVKILNEERDRGRKHTLRQKLREIPGDLHELFRRILSINHKNGDELLLCFQLILFSKRPLTLLELHFAILSQTVDATDVGPDDLTEEDSKIFLLESSKGLAEITNSKNPTVQLIHETVKDFLLKDNGLRSLWPNLDDNFQGKSHNRLRDCCLDYLKNGAYVCDSLDYSRYSSSSPMIQMKKILPFMEYASQNVLFHANTAGELGMKQNDFISTFPRTMWIQVHNIFEKFQTRRYDLTDTELLYILAEADTPTLVEGCTTPEACLQIGTERYGCPLLAAMVNGNTRVVEAFRNNIASTIIIDDGTGTESDYCQQNTYLTKLGRGFNYVSSKKPILNYLASYGDANLLATILKRKDRLKLAQTEFGVGDSHDRFLFYDAAQCNNPDIMKLLVKAGLVDPGFVDNTSQSYAAYAVIHNKINVLKVLLESGRVDDVKDNQGQTPLSHAVDRGQVDMVKLLLETGKFDPDSKDNNGMTPLLHAVDRGQVDMVKLLLETGKVDPDSKDIYGISPLLKAVEEDHIDIIKLLLEIGKVDPDSKDNNGITPLSYAVDRGQVDMIKLLLETGKVDPDSKDNNGITPLSYAVDRGQVDMIKLLLETGKVDPDSKDIHGISPLLKAVREGHIDIIKLLLETGKVDPDSKDIHGMTPLSMAVRGDDIDIIKLLLETGKVDPDSKDIYGISPLLKAFEEDHIDAMKLLLETDKVDPDSKDNNGITLLSHAVDRGQVAMIKLLLETGKVDPDCKDKSGRTPLSYAAGRNRTGAEVVKLLLATGKVDPNSRDDYGRTPFLYAVIGGHMKAIKLLLETAQVDLDFKDKSGRTPFSYSADRNRTEAEVVKLLLATGKVDPNSRDDYGRTPLLYAVIGGHMKAIKLLLETAQVDPDCKDISRRTPLSYAVGRDGIEVEVVNLLLATGKVDPNSRDDYGRTPLLYAAGRGRTEVLKLLLATGKVNPESKDDYGRTPLSRAALEGQVKVIKLLLETRQVDPNSKDKDGRTPLMQAAVSGRLSAPQAFRIILESGLVDYNAQDISGDTALSLARKHGSETAIRDYFATGLIPSYLIECITKEEVQSRMALFNLLQ